MKTLLAVVFLLFTVSFSEASIANVYIGQAASGSGDGSSCANQKALSFFNNSGNWGAGGTQIGSDSTVHVCGTSSIAFNTNALTFQGSGASGHVITLKFEVNAVLTSPAWPHQDLGGAIDLAGHSFIVIDGGTNGTITATANGSGLAHQIDSTGFKIDGAHDLEIKNLSVTHLYNHTSTTDVTSDPTNVGCIHANGLGNNILIHDNTFTDGPWCLNLQYNETDSNIQIYNNDISRMAHGLTLGASGTSGHLSNVLVYGNHIHDFDNWSTTDDHYHLTGVHVYGVNDISTIATIDFYNNLFDGAWGGGAGASCPGGAGACITAFVFIEANSSGAGMSGLRFFNNVGISDAPINNGLFGLYDGNSPQIYNNTMIGSTSSAGVCFGSNTNLTGIQFKNNVMTSCDQLIYLVGSFAAGSPDYNIYANGGGNAFVCGSNFYTFGQFASWKACIGSAGDAHSSAPASANLNGSTGHPNTGSPVINAGTNLTSLGIIALDSDKAGTARPGGATAWDVGGFQFATGGCVTPSKLVFTGQPPNGSVSQMFGPVTIGIQDSTGNPCTTSTNTVRLALHAGTPFACFTSTTGQSGLSQPAVAGQATWNNLYILYSSGTGTLDATDQTDGLTSATSTPFTITAPGLRISCPSPGCPCP